ncbi:hypothetical protein X801_08319, partial [Opisthorchis viverrini]
MEIKHLRESAGEGVFLFTSYFSPFMFIATDVLAKRTQPDPPSVRLRCICVVPVSHDV